MPVPQQVSESLTGEWQIGLFESPCKAPASFCAGCLCPCCCAIQQRNELLDLTGEPYICCAGLCPCGPLGEPQDRNCLYLEGCCCTSLAISGNRFFIQTRFDKMNTACDDCILWATCMIACGVSIASCFIDIPQEVENCVDCMLMIVDGCMLAQQQYELEHVKKNGYALPPQQVMMALPDHQRQVINQGKPTHPGVAAGIIGGAAVIGGTAAGMAAFSGGGGGAGGGGQGGWMNTQAPNGQLWSQYCGASRPQVQNGMLAGPWGECMAWAKLYEKQNPGWENDPTFQGGPAGQIIEALQRAGGDTAAADRLEQACEQAADSGHPLPIINQRA